MWGTQNKVNSAEDCCQQCASYRPPSEDDMNCNGVQPAGMFKLLPYDILSGLALVWLC